MYNEYPLSFQFLEELKSNLRLPVGLFCVSFEAVTDGTHTGISNSSKLLVKSVLEMSGSGGREQQGQRDLPSQVLPKPVRVPCRSNTDPNYNGKARANAKY